MRDFVPSAPNPQSPSSGNLVSSILLCEVISIVGSVIPHRYFEVCRACAPAGSSRNPSLRTPHKIKINLRTGKFSSTMLKMRGAAENERNIVTE